MKTIGDEGNGRNVPLFNAIKSTGTFLETVENKPKPKTAAAGGGSTPPNKPPKGPTGPKNPNKGNDNENEKKYTGGLSKSSSSKNEDRINPRDMFKRKK